MRASIGVRNQIVKDRVRVPCFEKRKRFPLGHAAIIGLARSPCRGKQSTGAPLPVQPDLTAAHRRYSATYGRLQYQSSKSIIGLMYKRQ